MKRYLIFSGRHYYPCGGIDDLIANCDTIEECKKAFDHTIIKGYTAGHEDIDEYLELERVNRWAHIFDTLTMKKVWTH